MNRTNTSRSILLGSLVAVALTACTTSKQQVKVEGPKVATTTTADGQPAAVPQVSSRAKLYFDDGMKLVESGKKSKGLDYAAIERKFTQAAEEDPRFGEAWYNLGVLSERQGKTDQAVDHYKRALNAKPSLRQAAENLAVIQTNKGDVAGAVAIYQQILTVYPDDASSRARLADIYRQSGESDRALEFAREALVRDPKSLGAYKVLMLVNLERKQLSMAKLVALRALKLDEGDPELYHTIGLILLQEGEPQKARVQFQKAAEVRPDYQPSQVMLAKIALQMEDYAGAEEHLRRILQADGKNVPALVALGVAYKGQGQYDKAMQAYDAAEKLEPNLASIQFNRGVIMGDQKQIPEKAIEYFKKFISLTGGENGVPVDHVVFAKIRENEDKIRAKEEEKRALEEAARMEAEAKKQAEEMERQAAQEAAAANKANAAKDALATGDDGKDVKAASGTEPEKKEEKKEAPKPPAPEKKVEPKAESADEPSEEPADGL